MALSTSIPATAVSADVVSRYSPKGLVTMRSVCTAKPAAVNVAETAAQNSAASTTAPFQSEESAGSTTKFVTARTDMPTGPPPAPPPIAAAERAMVLAERNRDRDTEGSRIVLL